MKYPIPYKNTMAAKGSRLAEAILESPAAAKKVYNETTARFDALYPAGDRQWFENWSNERDLRHMKASGAIVVSSEDLKMLLDLQQSAAGPNAALQAAFARHKERNA